MTISLHKSSGTGGLPKLLKFYRTLAFTFLRRGQVCMGKCSEFQMTSPLEPLGK